MIIRLQADEQDCRIQGKKKGKIWDMAVNLDHAIMLLMQHIQG